MSTAQILEEIKSYPTTELQSLENSIRLERLQRTRRGLGAQETRLFEIINEPLPGGDELRDLRIERDTRALDGAEHQRLIQLENEREIVWARKLKAVSQLADLRGEEFDALYQQLGLMLRAEN